MEREGRRRDRERVGGEREREGWRTRDRAIQVEMEKQRWIELTNLTD